MVGGENRPQKKYHVGVTMKKIYRCEFCDFIGTKKEVLKHENNCIYKIRSCDKCSNARVVYDIKTDIAYYICSKGKSIKKEDGFNTYCDMFVKRNIPLSTYYYKQLENNPYIKEQKEKLRNE